MSVLKQALNDWRSLNRMITDMREDQVLAMLEMEKAGQRRTTVLERLHARYNTLRVARERKELLNDLI